MFSEACYRTVASAAFSCCTGISASQMIRNTMLEYGPVNASKNGQKLTLLEHHILCKLSPEAGH